MVQYMLKCPANKIFKAATRGRNFGHRPPVVALRSDINETGRWMREQTGNCTLITLTKITWSNLGHRLVISWSFDGVLVLQPLPPGCMDPIVPSVSHYLGNLSTHTQLRSGTRLLDKKYLKSMQSNLSHSTKYRWINLQPLSVLTVHVQHEFNSDANTYLNGSILWNI